MKLTFQRQREREKEMPRAKKWFIVFEHEDSREHAQRYLMLKSSDGLLKKRSEPLGRIKDVSSCLAL